MTHDHREFTEDELHCLILGRKRRRSGEIDVLLDVFTEMLVRSEAGGPHATGVAGEGPAAGFAPCIFTRTEVRSLLGAADRLPYWGASPLRHLVMPEVFRVLYRCGMRVGEVLRLTVADADLDAGVLRVRQGKFRKDRLVPMAPSLTERLRRYCLSMGGRAAEADSPLFQNRSGGAYAIR